MQRTIDTRRSLCLSPVLMRSLSRSRLLESVPAMLKPMQEQRDSGVSWFSEKLQRFKSKTTFRWRRRGSLLRGASGDCRTRVLWKSGEARAGRSGEARCQAGGPHCVRADCPLQGLQVGKNKYRSAIFITVYFRYCDSGNYQMCVPHHVYGFHQVNHDNCVVYWECYPMVNFRSHREPWQATFCTLRML